METSKNEKMEKNVQGINNKDQKKNKEQSDIRNWEAEGACEDIVGKDEEEVCQVKT
jgi:hypothetical protein